MPIVKAIPIALVLLFGSSAAMADNRWYLVSAICSSKQDFTEAGNQIYEYVAITEGDGQEGASDRARFGFSRVIAKQYGGQTCYGSEISAQNTKANYVGDSRQEAEGYLQKYVKKERSKKTPNVHLTVMDFDAAKGTASERQK